ncbi:hypothetical protein DPMN_008371 [Dreissena polymorpha]|uniref:Uncharacterized protein n=1 Tax=Dreissena polymorpha TaxID=45954 RepID=A0A9D4MXZ0_DREPO|nr:hypothetical protein DPMN_008371 [Dreissena polymorpha]
MYAIKSRRSATAPETMVAAVAANTNWKKPVRVIGFRKAAVCKVGVADETVSLTEGKRIANQSINNPTEIWKPSRGTQLLLF